MRGDKKRVDCPLERFKMFLDETASKSPLKADRLNLSSLKNVVEYLCAFYTNK